MRETNQLTPDQCWSVLRRQRHGHLAGHSTTHGPVVRTLHHAILDNDLYFHGRPRGIKRAMLDATGVFECVDVIAPIPSYWIDPVRACPATTYYRSVQVSGHLSEVADRDLKARVLAALMDRLQPEGRHSDVNSESAEYRAAINGLLVFRLRTSDISGRINVGQRHGEATMDRVLRGMWERGAPGDLAAIETVLRERKDIGRPDWLRGPAGVEMLVEPTPRLAAEAAQLLTGQYWNGSYDLKSLAQAQEKGTAWIGALDPASDRLVATSAALGNWTKHAWIYDVAVAPSHQHLGVGTAMLRLLLEHPTVRQATLLSLRTLNAHSFYRRVGFVDAELVENTTGASTMLLRRSPQE